MKGNLPMRCLLALGGNLGDVRNTFHEVVSELNSSPQIHVLQMSSFHETAPLGNSTSPKYLNAALEVETQFTPEELLQCCQQLETRWGRTRETHWGDRTLDLDLLLYGSSVFTTEKLTIPHDGCWYRRFVLDPVCEIAPDVLHPVKHLSFNELRSRLLLGPPSVALWGPASKTRKIEELLSHEYPHVKFQSVQFEALEGSHHLWHRSSHFQILLSEELAEADKAKLVLDSGFLNLSEIEDASESLRGVLSAAFPGY